MLKQIKKLLNSGTSLTDDFLLQKKIVLTNGIGAFIGLCSIPFVFIFYFNGSRLLGGVIVVIIAIFFSVLFFNKRGDFNLSRHLLLLTWSIGVFVYSLALGKETTLQNCFFSLVAVPFLLFLPNEKSRFGQLVLPLAFYFLIEYNVISEFQKIDLSEKSISIIKIAVTPMVLLQIIFILYLSGKHELGLVKSKNEAKILLDSLEKQRGFLIKKLTGIEKKEADLKILLSSLDDVVLEVNEEGVITDFWSTENNLKIEKSKKVSEYFGLLMQKKIEHAYDRFDLVYLNKIHEYTFNNKIYQFKITPLNRGGSTKNVAIIVRDITVNKNLQLEYDEFKKEKELESRSEQFKSSFLANMSHEIRTPLNGVVGMIDLLKDTDLDTTQKEYADILQSSSNNLLGLINDILDLSKIEAGKMTIDSKRFNVHRLAKNLVELFKPMSLNTGTVLNLSISKDVPNYIEADSTKISQVLTNLISNAVKFTIEGNVNVRVGLKNSNNIYFEVEDTGEGIPKESQKILFKKFTQLTGANESKIKGTGLGLSIVKELVALMGGEINLESEVNVGSTFTFDVKFVSTNQEVIKEVVREDEFKSMKILLVDDISVNRKVASIMLKKLNCEIVEAVNGKEAISIIEEEQFDLVLMDIQMPVMDGIEALTKLREMNVTIPIIALSANALEGDKEKYLKLGFNNYISKPITLKSLKTELIGY